MSDAISKVLGLRASTKPILQRIRAFTVSLVQAELAAAESAGKAAASLGISYRALRRIVDTYPREFGQAYDMAVTAGRSQKRLKHE